MFFKSILNFIFLKKTFKSLKITKEKEKSLKSFVDKVNIWNEILEKKDRSLIELINDILTNFDYWSYLANLNEERENNVQQLLNICKEWEKNENFTDQITNKDKLINFLNYIFFIST